LQASQFFSGSQKRDHGIEKRDSKEKKMTVPATLKLIGSIKNDMAMGLYGNEMIPQIEEAIRNAASTYVSFPKSKRTIEAFKHCDSLVQDSRNQGKDVEITCKKGCAACCYQEVAVTAGEAKEALVAAKKNGIAIDWDRAENQSKWGFELDNPALNLKMPIAQRKCVFLSDENTCGIYESRP
jgi:ferredoxin